MDCSFSKMERDSQENISEVGKGTRDSYKKKGPSDYYFWVVDEVKSTYSLYTNQQILDYFFRDYRIACLGKEHFLECLPCKPSDRAYHIAQVSDDKEPIFFFVYDIFFSTVGIKLPFTNSSLNANLLIVIIKTQNKKSFAMSQLLMNSNPSPFCKSYY